MASVLPEEGEMFADGPVALRQDLVVKRDSETIGRVTAAWAEGGCLYVDMELDLPVVDLSGLSLGPDR